LVLVGTGSAFSAGVDLFRILDGGEDYAARFIPALSGAFDDIFAYRRPVVAAVNGHAIAGGCVIVSCADHRLMADGRGRIGVPELLVGVPFPAVALLAVRYGVGDVGAADLVYSGATLLPDEALRRGLARTGGDGGPARRRPRRRPAPTPDRRARRPPGGRGTRAGGAPGAAAAAPARRQPPPAPPDRAERPTENPRRRCRPRPRLRAN